MTDPAVVVSVVASAAAWSAASANSSASGRNGCAPKTDRFIAAERESSVAPASAASMAAWATESSALTRLASIESKDAAAAAVERAAASSV